MNAKTLIAGLFLAATLVAQPPGGPRGFGPGGPGGPGMMGGRGMMGGGRGMMGGGPPQQTVTGAPYSGIEVHSRSQVLANGTVIQHQDQVKVSRDSQGRVRRETTRQTPDGKTENWVTISDPVAGMVYELNATNKTAFSRPAHFPNSSQQAAGARAMRQPNVAQPDNNVKRETMAARSMNGVIATGTRTTRTIPAGTIGNSQPIETVHESWMSEDLKVPVLVKMSDPRSGTTSTELTNVLRGEPDASLFQVPSDYTVKKGMGGPGRGPRGGGAPFRKQ